MNSLETLLQGLRASLMANALPAVSDSYARGQIIGVAGMLDALAARVQWLQAPLAEKVALQHQLLQELAVLAASHGWNLPALIPLQEEPEGVAGLLLQQEQANRHAVGLVEWLQAHRARIGVAQAREFDRWMLAWALAQLEVDNRLVFKSVMAEMTG